MPVIVTVLPVAGAVYDAVQTRLLPDVLHDTAPNVPPAPPSPNEMVPVGVLVEVVVSDTVAVAVVAPPVLIEDGLSDTVVEVESNCAIVADAVPDGALVPTEFMAETLYVYVVPAARPVSEYEVDVEPVLEDTVDQVVPLSVDLSIL